MNTDVKGFYGDYRFLSNYWYVDIELDGEIYPTIEHAFQAVKTFDLNERLVILNAPSPGKAKELGQKVKLRPDWESVKISLMKDCLRKKFSVEKYKQKLLATGNGYIEETNT